MPVIRICEIPVGSSFTWRDRHFVKVEAAAGDDHLAVEKGTKTICSFNALDYAEVAPAKIAASAEGLIHQAATVLVERLTAALQDSLKGKHGS